MQEAGMNCKKAESMVNAYIDGKLAPKELEEFLKHVRTCDSCYDELETYYTIRVAIQYLDDGSIQSYDIKKMLEHDMHIKELSVKRYKRKNIILVAALFLVVLFVFTVIIYELAPTQVELVMKDVDAFLRNLR